MAAERTCPRCGTLLSSEALEGLCPKCVGRAVFERKPNFIEPNEAGGKNIDQELTVDGHAEPANARQEGAGERIGRYKLLQEIGEGGFGTVWMAEQMEPVSRRVALKIIKLGMDTREVIARFEQERQALAMMDHPNIAKVHDAGATQSGRPFFVMELVKGMPITQYCDEAGLGTRQRLALFGDVCSAINHAHQKGIIHRDIKPSNVMVTQNGDKPLVKVIDFGIAKATQGKLTDKTLFTRFEQFIGTPVYMSPEQASTSGLDIDTRSDIYALGVLLYELLTGKPPFDAKSLASAGYEEMRRIIREVEPPKPSTRVSTMRGEERTTLAKARHIAPDKLNRLVEPDLDWIVMKAIEKDRTRRYETANGLAADIQRFLADEPVSATPPSVGYQFRKFARRNKAALRLVAGIAAVLVAATAMSTWQAVRATKAEKKTADTLVQVAAESDAKELARKDAEDISTFLGEVFQSPDPERDGRTITVAETLDTAAKKLETDLASQPGHQARLQATLGRTYHALGLYREAIPLKEKYRNYVLAASGPEHPNTLSAMHNLAMSYFDAGRGDEALKMREEVLPLRRKVNGPEHPETLRAMHGLALSYHNAGRRDEALKLREKILPLSREVNGPEHPDTLMAMNNLAISYADASRSDEAIKLHAEALTFCRNASGPEHPSTLVTMTNLAVSYAKAGRLDGALKLQEAVLTLSRKVRGSEHPGTLGAMHDLALSYFDAGRRDEALKMQEEVLTLRRKVSGPEHPATLAAMNNLANSYADAGRRDEALKMQEELLTLRRKVSHPEHPETLTAMSNRANSYDAAGRRDEALKMREEVLPLRRKVLGPEHPDTLTAMEWLASSYADAGRREEALKMREELLTLRRKVNGPEDQTTLGAMSNLAGSYGAVGRLAEAIKLQEQSLTIKRRVLPPSHPYLAVALRNMADFYEKDGRKDEALTLREEELTLSRKVNGPEHRDTLAAMQRLAISYHAAGRREEVLKMREEVLTLSRKVNGPEDSETLGAMTNLAISYGAAGRLAEAIELQEQSLAIKRRVLPPNHPHLAIALRNLAKIYDKTDRKAEAEELRRELGEDIPGPALAKEDVKPLEAALESTRKAKGPEHEDTITAMTKLAAAYSADGSGRKAITLGEEALALARRVLSAGDKRTLAAMKVLVPLYKTVELDDDARKLEAEMQALTTGQQKDGVKPAKP